MERKNWGGQFPSTEEIEKFWGNIWGNSKNHNEAAAWIQQQLDTNMHLEYQEWSDIMPTESAKTSNWKSPGLDGIANFWMKNLHSIHGDLARE